MFNRVKNALYNAVSNLDSISAEDGRVDGKKRTKFPYSRPSFLQLNTNDEVLVSADHVIRPIIVPRDISKMPWNAGYAEAVNAGKSSRNEDQGAIQVVTLTRNISFQQPIFSTALKTGPSISSSNSKKITNEPNENTKVKDEAVVDNDSILEEASPALEFSTPPSTPDMEGKKLNIHVEGDNVLENKVDAVGDRCKRLPYKYFGIFDGHAGSGAAVVASNELSRIIQEKLMNVIELLIPPENDDEVDTAAQQVKPFSVSWNIEKTIETESLVIGALESAFLEMDNVIATDRFKYKITGGCTSLVALFIFGKVFVANAGDSRAVICKDSKPIPMSNDFTPETERERAKYLARLHPQLLGEDFTRLEFVRRPLRKDIGKKLLCRDSMMKGWAYKTVTVEDLKFPLVYGEGKRSRLLATIGVTRGFGDHDLTAQNSDVLIKPFLSPQPEVKVYDLMKEDATRNDVLVMGTDGLWDITSNEKAAEIVQKSLDHFPYKENSRCQIRYTSAAQDLVMHSRGKLRDRNWRTSDDKPATIDDISVFVIPLLSYKEEFKDFLQLNNWVNSKL